MNVKTNDWSVQIAEENKIIIRNEYKKSLIFFIVRLLYQKYKHFLHYKILGKTIM